MQNIIEGNFFVSELIVYWLNELATDWKVKKYNFEDWFYSLQVISVFAILEKMVCLFLSFLLLIVLYLTSGIWQALVFYYRRSLSYTRKGGNTSRTGVAHGERMTLLFVLLCTVFFTVLILISTVFCGMRHESWTIRDKSSELSFTFPSSIESDFCPLVSIINS